MGLNPDRASKKSERFGKIKQTLLSTPNHLCTERAHLITEYFKSFDDASEPMLIRKAKAFRYLLQNKSVRIFENELIVGNVGKQRKSVIIQPELSSIFSSQELFWIDKRKTTPFQISWPDRLKYFFRVIPYWLTRNMIVRAFFPDIKHLLRYTVDQLNPNYFLINEVAGIGHFLPHYEKVIRIGLRGYLEELKGKDNHLSCAMRITIEGVIDFAGRMAQEADLLADREPDAGRQTELREIARFCRKVPENPAESFREAVQSLWLAHLAVCLEGVNSAVSFGRLDQILFPYYEKDLAAGRITPEKARELLLCFSAKATEHVFLVSEKMSQYHGGFLTAQAAIVGGMDSDGKDAANDLSYIFLDVMKESGLRDPNYQVRFHQQSPPSFVEKAIDAARAGNGSPAFFSDEATISALKNHGYPEYDARNYAVVGCVEPTIPGKSFCSTDAALVNLPVCLELALNRGRRLGKRKRIGCETADPLEFQNMDELLDAFRLQVEQLVQRLVNDIQVIEKGNRDFHPTPFSSMLVDGCFASGKDVTEGGAVYNSSGIQGVGVADVADSLAAMADVVFERQKATMNQVLKAVRTNFTQDAKLRAQLLAAPKFGNDQFSPDLFADKVVHIFHAALSRYQNTRGGPYIPGFYSSTSHVGFGEQTGALPSGRLWGEPFAASLSSVNGQDRQGPTAVLNSVASINTDLSPNGYALNLSFDPQTVAGEKGIRILDTLINGFFDQGGMEVQLNVLDPQILEDARQNPGNHPGIVVRVAGYCAYFNDLSDSIKQEIITRNRQQVNVA